MHPEEEKPTLPAKVFGTILAAIVLTGAFYVPAKLNSNKTTALEMAFNKESIPKTQRAELKPVILNRNSCAKLPDRDTCERVQKLFNSVNEVLPVFGVLGF